MNPVVLAAIFGAVGIAIGTIITGIFTIIIDWRRRVGENRQFTLESALRLTKMKDEQFSETAKLLQNSGKSIKLHINDPFINLLWYHKQLNQLMKGKSSEIEAKFKKQLDQIEVNWVKDN